MTRVLLAVNVLGLSSSPHFQSLRENTGAQEHWVTPRDRGGAGLRYLCPKCPYCCPAQVAD